MTFNYSKLKGRIVERFGSQTSFAKALSCSERTLSLKLNNKVPWKQTEICEVAVLLEISDEEIQEFFFTKKVQNI